MPRTALRTYPFRGEVIVQVSSSRQSRATLIPPTKAHDRARPLLIHFEDLNNGTLNEHALLPLIKVRWYHQHIERPIRLLITATLCLQ